MEMSRENAIQIGAVCDIGLTVGEGADNFVNGINGSLRTMTVEISLVCDGFRLDLDELLRSSSVSFSTSLAR